VKRCCSWVTTGRRSSRHEIVNEQGRRLARRRLPEGLDGVTRLLVAGCVRLITGADTDAALIVALGGPPAQRLLAGHPATDQLYWLRVWAARGLLWAWEDGGLDGVHMALNDPAWWVREMAAKVAALHTSSVTCFRPWPSFKAVRYREFARPLPGQSPSSPVLVPESGSTP
jgi:hypothetical protein